MANTSASFPTMYDAREAAAVLASAGAGQVMVFGSVARGDAKPGSDIDLVAVFDDLGDYSDRHHQKEALRETVEDAVGWDCGVVLTDRSEWRTRVEKVSSSFERAISRESVMLVDRPPAVGIDWDKPTRKPADNTQEAECYLVGFLRPRLRKLADAMFQQYRYERLDTSLDMPEQKRHAFREEARLERMRTVCEHSAIIVEVSLKGLAALAGRHPISEKQMRAAGYDFRRWLEQVPASHLGGVSEAFEEFGGDLAALSRWKADIACEPVDEHAEQAQYAVADGHAEAFVKAALAVAQAAVTEYENRTCDTNAYYAYHSKQIERIAAHAEKHGIRCPRPYRPHGDFDIDLELRKWSEERKTASVPAQEPQCPGQMSLFDAQQCDPVNGLAPVQAQTV